MTQVGNNALKVKRVLRVKAGGRNLRRRRILGKKQKKRNGTM